MNRTYLILALICCLFLAAPAGQTSAAPPGPIVVDRTSLALYDQIPQEYFAAAEALTMFYTDRSVGANVDEALNCLAAPHASAPNYCKRYIHRDPTYNTTPADVYWTGAHSRANWRFVLCDGVDCTLAQYLLTPVQAFGYFPSFLEAPQIADTFFSDNPSGLDIYDLAAFEAAHPETTMIYFTSSLSRSEVDDTRWFNDQMRAWTAANGKVLFDFADIVGHTPQGQPCYDNRDGVAYAASATQYENYSDDRINTPAICPQYTTEVDGGHLGSVSAAKVRVGKAMWVLMAQLAGWQPGGSVTPTPTNTPLPVTPTNTPLPAATATNTPLPTATHTPAPPPSATMHVGDLDGWASVADPTRWRANVRVTVHDAAHAPVVGARIAGYWDSAFDITVSCTTKTTGECVLANNNVAFSASSIAFNVKDVTHAAYSYVATATHDPDGDSDGVAVVIARP